MKIGLKDSIKVMLYSFMSDFISMKVLYVEEILFNLQSILICKTIGRKWEENSYQPK